MGSERISPTAHYTGYTWVHNGLSHPALATAQGRAMHAALRPLTAASQLLGVPTLEGLLLARHRSIDAQLHQAIAQGRITQIVEIAAGLSPRGWDFASRYGQRLTYVEADLAPMAQRKRGLLERAGLTSPQHRVVALDALADEGPLSLQHLAQTLDKSQGLAIVTEGLLNYFPTAAVEGMWRRFALTLSGFRQGLYLSDLHLQADNHSLGVTVFTRLLSSFVRGRVFLHYADLDQALIALRAAGFAKAQLDHPEPQMAANGRMDLSGARLVRVVRAQT